MSIDRAVRGGHVLSAALGIAVEHTVSTCSTDCTTYYPDLTIALAF